MWDGVDVRYEVRYADGSGAILKLVCRPGLYLNIAIGALLGGSIIDTQLLQSEEW